jgi:hypothetical protein
MVWLGVASLLAVLALFGAAIVVSYELLHDDTGSINTPSSLEPVRILGPEETVFSWARERCEVFDIPDLPARAFRDEAGRVHLIAAHSLNMQFVGPGLNRLRHPCAVAMKSNRDANPSRFNDSEWLAAPYTEDGRTVYALVHNEYHGHEHPGRCTSGDYINCWYNGVTLAVSRDGGASFRAARPPPAHLVAAVPYRYVPDDGPYGLFNPSNIVRNEDDGFYYTMLRTEKYREQKRGSCLLRTKRLDDPASWRAWDGSGFGVAFANPYSPSLGAPSDHLCEPVSQPRIDSMHESLTYNTYLDKYLLVGMSAGFDRASRRTVWGIYYSVSDDLIDWSQAKLIREVELPWTFKCGDKNPVLYPSLIDPDSTSRNFETTGRSPYMYFTRYHYTNCKQNLNRDLIRVRLEFSE